MAIRKGARGPFFDKGLEGASHHAVIPNVNTVYNLREVWPRLSIDEKKLFDVIARAYLPEKRGAMETWSEWLELTVKTN